MTHDEAVKYLEDTFGSHDKWRGSMDGGYSLGTYAFGALIEPVRDKYRVTIGRNLGWGQARDAIARAEFDTLEEAADFGMLIYKQNKPAVIDRTRVRGYPV